MCKCVWPHVALSNVVQCWHRSLCDVFNQAHRHPAVGGYNVCGLSGLISAVQNQKRPPVVQGLVVAPVMAWIPPAGMQHYSWMLQRGRAALIPRGTATEAPFGEQVVDKGEMVVKPYLRRHPPEHPDSWRVDKAQLYMVQSLQFCAALEMDVPAADWQHPGPMSWQLLRDALLWLDVLLVFLWNLSFVEGVEGVITASCQSLWRVWWPVSVVALHVAIAWAWVKASRHLWLSGHCCCFLIWLRPEGPRTPG